MLLLIVLAVTFVVFRGLGLFVPYFSDWQYALRAALGVLFLMTASAHWGMRREDLMRMVPRSIGDAGMWVTVTGAAEVAIGVGLQIRQVALITALTAVLMLCCLLPANIKAAREGLTLMGKPVMPIGPRILLQGVFIGALLACVWPLF